MASREKALSGCGDLIPGLHVALEGSRLRASVVICRVAVERLKDFGFTGGGFRPTTGFEIDGPG